jgi:2-keto-3-deoxy-L-fuconate dehydrogenase
MKAMLQDLRVLITEADRFMGPALCETFAQHGARIVASRESMTDPSGPQRAVAAAGEIDVLVINLGHPAASTAAVDATDDEWRDAFAALVDPLPRLVRAALPPMIRRRSGRMLLMGSAAALRGQKRPTSYSAARGAQLAYVQVVGLEAAPHNVQVNAIAQNLVDSPTYFPPEVQANPRFQERLQREVPLGRLVSAREDAEFAADLCSPAASCFVGQVFPICGGWVTR